ncbi:Uncharacterized protein Adt_06197 [Abeliophyllum distichum]|uniref:Gag-pol polyprotein n=1 Tax=Abeliophyllum distichum TaxID=126358 RepID=A0ABD1V679_9LAMI
MAKTSSKAHEEHLRKVDKEMGDLNAAFRAMTNINQKYESLVAMMAQLRGRRKEAKDKQAESSSPQATPGGGFGSNKLGSPQINPVREDTRLNTKIPKIDFSYFSGEGPMKWVRKARKYFQLHQVAEELKVGIA